MGLAIGLVKSAFLATEAARGLTRMVATDAVVQDGMIIPALSAMQDTLPLK